MDISRTVQIRGLMRDESSLDKRRFRQEANQKLEREDRAQKDKEKRERQKRKKEGCREGHKKGKEKRKRKGGEYNIKKGKRFGVGQSDHKKGKKKQNKERDREENLDERNRSGFILTSLSLSPHLYSESHKENSVVELAKL